MHMQLARSADSAEPLIDHPIYTPTLAARYLRLPVTTVRWWTLGNGAHLPAIRIADPDEQLLSFRNVTEVHVLSAVMCQDRDHIPMSILRTVVTLAQEELHSEHPLSEPGMLGDGKEFFAKRFGQLMNVSRHGQAAITALLGAYLDRIGRDERGAPTRLLVFTRARPEGPRHVMIDPAVQAGQPCITGSTIRVEAVADGFREGRSVTELARAHGHTGEEIEEAIRYWSEVR
jgi:uncharacterized protein (DUF433 family)